MTPCKIPEEPKSVWQSPSILPWLSSHGSLGQEVTAFTCAVASLETIAQQSLFPGERILQTALPPCYVRQSRNSGLSGRAKLPFFSQVKEHLNTYLLSQDIKMKGAVKLTKQLNIPAVLKVSVLPQDAILTNSSRVQEWLAFRKQLPHFSRKTQKYQKKSKGR